MTSLAKVAANRRNAQRSTGPRSAAGKARARRNAFRHGLSSPPSLDPVARNRIDDLVSALTGDFPSKLERELATLAAEAQTEIERVRQAKVTLVNRAYAPLRREGDHLLSVNERAALAFADKAKILMACARYERRAISGRNRVMRMLARVQQEVRREEARELVGPPLPKPPRIARTVFREHVLLLEVGQIMRCSHGKTKFLRLFDYRGRKSVVGAAQVATDGNRGWLQLNFEVDGETIDRTFELVGTAMRVGGVRWSVRCPESRQLVRNLYLLLRPNHAQFRSRHALGLSYRSSYLKPKERYRERVLKLMNLLGVQGNDPPIRPKNMQRRTFEKLSDELFDAILRDASAILESARALRGSPGGDDIWKEAWELLTEPFMLRGLSPDDVFWNGKTYEYRPPPRGPTGRKT